ncbi:ABC transporter substrate-binding protein [Leifsonia kafniensis]|uniref:ABC transporter substrate-binding protein n=1 Tax=Leifsonia kafniensis TaxID=475957 RepID=A0ABP7K2R3_9MICO
MTQHLTRPTRILVSLGVIALLATMTGCGRSASSADEPVDTSSSTSGSESGTDAASLVPAALKEKGVLKVATAEGYPPMEMYAEGTTDLIGVDPELAELIATQLGLSFEISNASFPGLIPGLQSKQWDLALSSMSDTEERRQAVNFVDYFVAGGAIMVPLGNPESIGTIADLCGKNIVGAKGSSNLAILQSYSTDECASPMIISESEDAPTGLLQLDTGRAVATMVDFPVAKKLASIAGKYEVLPEQYEAGPWGIAIDKNDQELTKAVQAALNELIENGEYEKLLTKYDVQDAGVTDAKINDGN